MLKDEPQETWGNTILWRLAHVMECPEVEDGKLTGTVPGIAYTVDPDKLLNQVCEILYQVGIPYADE